MSDLLEGVRSHYRANGLTGRLKAALAAFGSEGQRLTPQQLSTLVSVTAVFERPAAHE